MTLGHDELGVALLDVFGAEDRVGRPPLERCQGQYKELLSIATSKRSHAFLGSRPDGRAVVERASNMPMKLTGGSAAHNDLSMAESDAWAKRVKGAP